MTRLISPVFLACWESGRVVLSKKGDTPPVFRATGAHTDTAFRLATLGGLSLVGTGGAVTLSQRRRLALLALLAVVGEHGMQRDKLLLYLWPESTPETARHSLEQLIYGLRRELGQALFSSANPLVLDPSVLSSDVDDFGAAIRNGALAEAVQLYRGPFLDGFYLSGLPEFEEWTSTERRRLADACASALESLAAEAQRAGDHSRAAELWRKRVALDNLSARGALGLMRALAASGDRAGALQHARIHELLVSQQLQSPVDAEVAALASELRSEPANRSKRIAEPVGTSPPGTAAGMGPEAINHSGRDLSPGNDVNVPAPSASVTRRSSRRLFVGMAAIAVLLLVSSAMWVRFRGNGEPRAPALEQNSVVVLPFRFTGADSSHSYLAEGVVDLLAARLTGEGGPIAVDTRRTMTAWLRRSRSPDPTAGNDIALQVARDVGAAEALSGDVMVTRDGQLSFTGRLIDGVTGRPIARGSVAGSPDSLFVLIDKLAAQLLAARAGPDERNVAALTTNSLPALRAFLEGRAAHRRGDTDGAVRAFGRALEFDSTFALAAVDLALATGRLFQWANFTTDTVRQTRGIAFGRGGETTTSYQTQWRRALEIGWRERGRLNARDLALLNAVRGDFPRPTDARTVLRNWEAAVQAAPDRADTHSAIGEILLYQGKSLELADAWSRAGAAFRRALDLDPAYVRAIGGLIEIAAFERDRASLRRLGPLYFARDSTSGRAEYIRWRLATALGESAERAAILSRFEALGFSALDPIQWVGQVDGVALEDADRAMALIVARASENQERQIALYRAKFLALNRGRPEAAARITAAKREVEPNSDLLYGFAIRDALWWDGDVRVAHEGVRVFEKNLADQVGSANPSNNTVRSDGWRFALSLWRIRHHDTTGVVETITRFRNRPQNTGGFAAGRKVDIQAEVLAGLLALERNDREGAAVALRVIDSVALLGCCNAPHWINLVSARLHEHAGDLPGALAAVRRGRWLYPPEHLSTYLREEGRLASQTGDREGAIRAHKQYLVLRSDPEPSLKPQVDSARQALARLERAP